MLRIKYTKGQGQRLVRATALRSKDTARVLDAYREATPKGSIESTPTIRVKGRVNIKVNNSSSLGVGAFFEHRG